MATQRVYSQVALQKLACSYYMYIHLLCLRVKQDFRLVIELEIYLRGNARDAWGSSSFRDDLGLGKRRCGRTKLDSGRIVGYSEANGRLDSPTARLSAQWANAKLRPLPKMAFVAASLLDFPAPPHPFESVSSQQHLRVQESLTTTRQQTPSSVAASASRWPTVRSSGPWASRV